VRTGGKSLEVIIGLVNCVLSRTIFLGAFAQLRNATFSCVTSVRLSVLLSVRLSVHLSAWNRTTWLPLNELSQNIVFRQSVEKIQLSLKSDKNDSCFT
jgi:hypothetical protein